MANGQNTSADWRRFPDTPWSLLLSLRRADEEARRQTLDLLLRQYLPALRAHLLARRVPADRVDDLLQGFVADKVIERT